MKLITRIGTVKTQNYPRKKRLEILTGTADLLFILDLLLVTKSELLLCFSKKAGFIFEGSNRFVAKLHISAYFSALSEICSKQRLKKNNNL